MIVVAHNEAAALDAILFKVFAPFGMVFHPGLRAGRKQDNKQAAKQYTGMHEIRF